ncbi:tRNA-uridine aminocarboxypropyltransferase [Enterovibrio nigricans]|uniref:tRNA-uridine aminocarboxypropyltransferase n=1 Tax=Enterovibrio nigricans DSM 22720 TaxID=1121868 RepID=A0A1T4US70_9GAMM|nr:tRNA-uridine aminocarboxypropyltransferase [Enterovibrio nigricans]PKF51025.1 DTW domain-containing protein [Enterovibrio nigricans]SKA55562.1 DTW domain-containing protein YfiP [Enterovibrio nigricans DSM 22720]
MNKKASRYCEQCGKAKKACICHLITRIDSDIPVVVLQHSSEVNQPIGTARILSLSLPNCTLIVGEDFSSNEQLNSLLSKGDTEYALLYPAETATPINQWTPKETKQQGIILLDGTWRKAFKMYQLSNNLQALPCVMLDERANGNYRIRKSPKEGGLSTVEAGFHALAKLSGDTERFTPLIDAFNGMIEFQIKQMPPGVFERHYGKES